MGYQVCFALICVLVVRDGRGGAVADGCTGPGCWSGGNCCCWRRAAGRGWRSCRRWSCGCWSTARRVGRNQWKKGVDLAVLAAAMVGYAAVYFIGYERPPHHPPAQVENAGLAALIVGQYLSMSLGVGGGVCLAGGGGGGRRAGRLDRVAAGPRPRAWGVLAVLAGALGLAAAVGVGRSGFGEPEMGLWSRYGLLAWPVLFVAYLTFTGSDRPGRPVGPADPRRGDAGAAAGRTPPTASAAGSRTTAG